APSLTIAKNGTDVTYTVTYSGADLVTLAAGNVSLNTTGGATATVAVTGAGTVTRTVTLSNITGDGTIGISIAAGTASDTAGNTALGAGPSGTFTADNTAPTITGISAPSLTIAKNGTDVTYTVTYSGADTVTLAAGNVSLNTTGGATATVAVTGAGTVTRTVTLSNITGDGTIGISIAAGTASDTAGNTALGAGPSGTFTADNTAPTVTITAPAAGTWDGTQSLTFTPDDGTTDARISTGVWEAKASGVIINTLNGWGPPASGVNYTVEVRSTDPAGNIGSASRTYTMP
nr:hypothetical protein [Spirochaetota bacterium]